MREIKFRAWEKNEQEMCLVTEIHMDAEEIIKVGLQYKNVDYSVLRFPSSVQLMQYTGNKDRTGREIYEGDIVVWVVDVVVETIEGHDRKEPEGQIGVIAFGNAAWYVSGGEFYSYGEQMFSWSELEVIGNQYENPELLTS